MVTSTNGLGDTHVMPLDNEQQYIDIIRNNISELRVGHDWGWGTLAKRSGVEASRLRRIEGGVNNDIGITDLLAIASAFGVPLSTLLRGVLKPESEDEDVINRVLNDVVVLSKLVDDFGLVIHQWKELAASNAVMAQMPANMIAVLFADAALIESEKRAKRHRPFDVEIAPADSARILGVSEQEETDDDAHTNTEAG